MNKKTSLSRLEGYYLKDLRYYLNNLKGKARARRLGDRAVAMGLDMLDLVRIHEQALAKLLPATESSKDRKLIVACAGDFFAEASVSLEGTHSIALEASAHLMEIVQTLRCRTKELMRSKSDLKREISGRETSEAALKGSQLAFANLVRESQDLEAQLKVVAQQIMVKNEIQKHLVSARLRDEIAQMLLALNIRLLVLKQEITNNHASIEQEITATQRLVEEFMHAIQRFALELVPPHES